MQSFCEKKEKSAIELKVELDHETWQKQQTKAFNKLAKNTEVSGFRKGKAPANLVRKQLGEERILLEAANNSLDDMFKHGLDEHDLHPINQAQVDIVTLTVDDFVAKFLFEIMPEVILDESYKEINQKVKATRITAKMVNDEIEKLLKQEATWDLKEDGSVEMGNQVLIDYVGKDNGVEFAGGSATNYELLIGSKSFIDGFEDGLIGMKSEEQKTLNLTFPKDYPAADLAGKEVTFDVTLHEIRHEVLPELNDDFVNSLNREGVDTVEQLKADVKETLSTRLKEQNRQEAESEVMKQLIEKATIELPEALIQQEIDQILREFQQRLASQGLSFDLYKKLANQDEKALMEQMRPSAIERLQTRLVLEALVKKENIEATEEEVEKEYQHISEMYNLPVEQIKQMASVNDISHDVKVKKAYDTFLENSLS